MRIAAVWMPCCFTATSRRHFPKQYLHYHRAGHGAVTSPSAKRGYAAFVLSKMARLQGASGIHVGTMGYGKMEGEASDTLIAHMITEDSVDGPYFHQEWLGMNPTTPIISGGMNALRMPGFFSNLGHSNLIMTAGGLWLAPESVAWPVWVAALILLGLALFMQQQGYSFAGLWVSTGVAAAVLGLALQKTLGDLFSGIALGTSVNCIILARGNQYRHQIFPPRKG